MSQKEAPQKERSTRIFRRASVVLLLSVTLCGIAYLWNDSRYATWKEEVQLPDGRTFVVKQRRDHISGYGTRKTWLTFSVPELLGEQTWTESMQPILIAVSGDGQVYIAGWPSGEKQMDMYRHPRYGYAAFRWNGKEFQRIPFLSIPENLRKTENVIRCIPNAPFVTWATKVKSSCDEQSTFISGGSREIDLERMKVWARTQAARQNIEPLSD